MHMIDQNPNAPDSTWWNTLCDNNFVSKGALIAITQYSKQLQGNIYKQESPWA